MIINSEYNKNLILNIIQKHPDIGKTAIMKVIYMLQQVKGLNLDYDFSIYTYGPYSYEVTYDVDELISSELVTSAMYLYKNYVGYKLRVAEWNNIQLEKKRWRCGRRYFSFHTR